MKLLRKEFELLVAAQTDGKIWDKLEILVTKDGKTTVYPWKLKQLTKEEEKEEKERTKAFKEEEEKSMPPRDEEDPIGYGSDAGSTGSNMPYVRIIVTQVTANVNNAQNDNGGGGGQANNGCSYKSFQACGPKEYDGKGGAVALTRWFEKMETVIDNSGFLENQRVKYATSSLVNKALTWWKGQVQIRGRDATNGMTWNDFKALIREEFSSEHELEKLDLEL
ncbi:hypothetical protein Tco_0598209 [Tanacetum coccineum]